MSGFFGMFRGDGREVSRDLLQRIAGTLHTRGSSGETIWTQAGVGACFSFLQTSPTQSIAPQPARLGANWLLGDVRLDARADLLRQLTERGEIVPNDVPNEDLLLHAWYCWGEACLPCLLGDFSFAVYDDNERALWCARDFNGPRPFFYALTGGVFYFSNTLSALRIIPEISPQLDEAFIADFLLHGYSSDPARTCYYAIHRLPAGHVLKFQNHSVEVLPFLRLPIEEPMRLSHPREYLDAYREVLREAVRDRLPQGRSALYLSGGLDSGSVCAAAAQLAANADHKDQLKAFTISWRPLFEDPEPHFAALTAQRLNLNHEILEERTFRPFPPLEAGQHAAPEPNIDPFFTRSQRLYKRITAHSNVILSGDGGDDVLTGQSWPYFQKLWSDGEWSVAVKTLGSFVLSHAALPPLRIGLRSRLRRFLQLENAAPVFPDWLNSEFAERNHLQEKWHIRADSSRTDSVLASHPLHPYAYNALHTGFWSSILEYEDAGFTQVPLETRAPLLDLRVLRFLLRVPPVPWCVNKELTRRAMENFLPEAVRERPKSPMLRDPLEASLQGCGWAHLLPDSPPSAIRNYIDWKRWSATLGTAEGLNSGSIIFPLALALWLKDIENA